MCTTSIKVLAVVPGNGKGNSMIFARRQISALNALGAKTEVFFLNVSNNPICIAKEILRLRKQICTFKPDVTHAHYGTITAFASVCVSRVPVVVTYRGSDLNPIPSGSRLRGILGHILSQISAMGATRIICVSQELNRRLFLGGNKVIVIPTGVDTNVFKPIAKAEARACLGWDRSAQVVLFNAGRSPKVKRLDLAEMSVIEAQRTLPDIKFVVLRGDVPPEDIPLYHNAADVLLVTSDFEGSPTIVQEAVACGLPVVSVKVGDVLERLRMVTPSKIVPRNPSALGAALLEVLALKQRSNGPDVAVMDFANTVVVLKVLEVLRKAAIYKGSI